jgi:hypothetical protein
MTVLNRHTATKRGSLKKTSFPISQETICPHQLLADTQRKEAISLQPYGCAYKKGTTEATALTSKE